ncbi:MAG: AmmeMemoRadiSam system radical SAM enzyme [Acidobacteriota bacterium]
MAPSSNTYTQTADLPEDLFSPAVLWHPEGKGRVRCDLCAHRCSILPGREGVCKVRINRNGELVTLVRNRLVASAVDPIEKKPLFHFLPGTLSFSLATMGCNFRCRYCQNWQISQFRREGGDVAGALSHPGSIVRQALRSGCSTIAYTYTEPTIFFETAMEVGERARAAGLKNIFVSNGYMTPGAAQKARSFLDAANVDLKSFDDRHYRKVCGARLKGVLEGLEALLAEGYWVEVTTLLVPGVNDSDEELRAMARYLAKLNPDIPWHLSRFHPDYRMRDTGPTPMERMERAWSLGKEAGLRYIYLGNVPGDSRESTLCPGCGALVVERRGFTLRSLGLKDGRCASCGREIAGLWKEDS